MLALTELQIAQNRGDAVIELLARAEVAPIPALYGLAFDYVAGVESVGALRLGSLIEAPPTADATVNERLYDEFVRDYQREQTLEKAIGEMVERLLALDSVLRDRQTAAIEQSRSLAAAAGPLDSPNPDLALVRDWVERLATANRFAQHANDRLSGELEATAERLAGVREEIARLSRDALVDPVTGVANRAGIDDALAAAVGTARATPEPDLVVAVIDIDHFKRFNDTYGHQIGDEVLRMVARSLLASVRSEDVVGRIGGDEFVVLFRNLKGRAHSTGETIRRAVIGSDLSRVLGPKVLGGITASIGIAGYREGDTIASFLDRADRLLLEAKRTGRNRVVCDQPMGDDVELSEPD